MFELNAREALLYSELDSAWQMFKSGYEEDLDSGSNARRSRIHGVSDMGTSKPLLMTRTSSTYDPSKKPKSLLSTSLSEHSMHYAPPIPLITKNDLLVDDALGKDAVCKDQAVSFRVFEMEMHDARAKAADAKHKRRSIQQMNAAELPQSAPISAFRRHVSNPEPGGPSNDPKGKRKVTFNSELAVRTIETNVKKSETAGRRSVSTEGVACDP